MTVNVVFVKNATNRKEVKEEVKGPEDRAMGHTQSYEGRIWKQKTGDERTEGFAELEHFVL